MRFLCLALAILVAAPASAQLSGTYTIGGASPDYASLIAAVADLETQGISGNTIFQIRAGTYVTGFDLGPVAGVSETARIRFEASDANNPPVLQRPGATSGSNFVVRIDTDWVTLKNLEIEATAPAPVGRLVVLEDAENITIRNCALTGHVLPGSDEGTLIWADAPENTSGLVLDQSTMTQGYTGLDLIITNVDPGPDTLTVIDNTFINQEANGVSVLVDDGISIVIASEEADALIQGNTFETNASAWFLYRAVNLYGGGAWVEGNDIQMGDGIYAISVENTDGSVVVNNSIQVLSTATGGTSGAGIAAGSWSTIVYNTVSMDNGKPAIEMDDTISALDLVEIHNNIFSTSAGPVLQDNGALSVASSDHNVFITPGNEVEYQGTSTSLTGWQNATDFDPNTTTDAVTFVNEAAGDLHLAGASLDDFDLVAAPLPATLANGQLPAIETDFDGDPRDAYNPKRGADEGTLLSPLDNADVGGFYAVAGSSPDFASPTEAFSALIERGMKGPVTFRIRTGTYTLRESFPNDLRVGPAAADPAAAPLAIRAANPGSRPTLVSDASSGTNWTFRFRGLDHVELENLDFDASGAGEFGRIIVLKTGDDGEGTDELTITNNTFTGAASGVATDARALIWSDDDGHNELTITNSTFTDGWAGVYLAGSASDDSPDATLSDNTFTSQSAYGIYGSLGGVTLSGNTFTSGVSDATAIRLGAAEGYTVTGNQISLTNTMGTGLSLVGTDADGSGTALVANNFISANRGLVLSQGATGARVIHTSFYAKGNTATPVTVSGTLSRLVELKSSILWGFTGPALTLGQSDQLVASDGNVLYTGGSPTLVDVGATSYANLPAWKTASGQDANSESFLPQFVDALGGDLHLQFSDGDPRLAGLAGTGILADFDGEIRSLTRPYIGADELATPIPIGVELTLSVYLQGVATSTTPDGTPEPMRTDLAAGGLVPLTQPYASAIYDGTLLDYDGTENVASVPASAVDWVLVELREAFDGPAVARGAFLLDTNGNVRTTAGSTTLEFSTLLADTYFIVVRHRNHLALMSTLRSLTGTAINVDLFLASSVFGGAGAGVEIEPGVLAMAAADGSFDGLVTAPDFNLYSSASASGATGYRVEDYTLDGLVTAPDFNLYNANAAAGAATSVPEN